ncbi:MAG: PSD1 and planctomycete cytochrome C domain-containing protein [Planctomycetota bacterium]|nr:PSD1 and planctomycete cytochrome C domain-containing protein [Planctomycetota bacterium]
MLDHTFTFPGSSRGMVLMNTWLARSAFGNVPDCHLAVCGALRLAMRIAGTLLLTTCAGLPARSADSSDRFTHFEKQIRPLLSQYCWKCHGAKQQKGGLRLDSRAAVLAGGERGPAVDVGKPTASLLLQAVRYKGPEMPPTGQLSTRDVNALEQWIATGVAWPPTRSADAEFTPAARRWWAFQPLQHPSSRYDRSDGWSANEIDRLIWRRLQRHDMQPAPRSGRPTLLRRLYFDLIGLPPRPAEVTAFVQDPTPDAWPRRVDHLLADPRYGEHWSRHWLDLVRYSDSDGWNQDAYRPVIWRYRDYVIGAFNEDKPYPQFVQEQLAGDEIDEDDPAHLDAVGFLRLGIYEYNQRDARGHWNDIMNEMTDVTGDVFLGMSMACARCHDHKFDPVPQRDYFSLRAFFEPVIWRDDLPAANRVQRKTYEQQLAAWHAATEAIRVRIDQLLKPYHDSKWISTVDKFPLDIQSCFQTPVAQRSSWDHQMAYLVSRQFLEEGGGPLKNISPKDKAAHEELAKQLAAYDHLKPVALPKRMTVTDFPGVLTPTLIPENPQEGPIPPGFLSILSHEALPEPIRPATIRRASGQVASSGRRTALAKWIGRADNPLTNRVIVNRIWQQHFGQGIVSTPNNFGQMGQPPTHPELLDWLALSFIDHEWRTKHLHRQILMSETWRQSAHHPRATLYQTRDPADQLLWRGRVRRLTAEQIRDAILSASGELQQQVGGPGVPDAIPRRAIYVKQFRNTNETFLHAFDAGSGLKSVAVRNTTTTPTQSLLLINGKYTLARADRLAERLLNSSFTEVAELIAFAVQLTWGRAPTPAEIARCAIFLDAGPHANPTTLPRQVLSDFCHILFNANEFLYLD